VRRILAFLVFVGGSIAFFPFTPSSLALSPAEIGVVANHNNGDSVRLARFYMEKRGIPAQNLITITLDPAEQCDRSSYEKRIAAPVRKFLTSFSPAGTIKCLVTMYGVPLAITSPAMSRHGEKTIAQLRKKKETLRTSGDLFENSIAELTKRISYLTKTSDMRASVDSELTLVRLNQPVSHWLANPFYRGETPGFAFFDQQDVVMVSRLDGPSPSLVEKIIEDSLVAEKEGLTGGAYFDARWPDPGLKEVTRYAWYDRSIHRAAELVGRSGVVGNVVVDQKSDLFQPGPIRLTALYCGWYSLGKYIDAFSWQRGAVGYHLASSECSTLKKRGSRVWCKMMLEKGAAATIGPVGEPYVDAFPPPELFFSFLTAGRNLVESYFFSLPHLSWKMVLIGDPLYRPFARQGQAN